MTRTKTSSVLPGPEDRLAALQQVVLGLTSTLELGEVLTRVAHMAQTLAVSAHAHIFLYDPDRDELRLAASHWASDLTPITLVPRRAGITHTVATTGKPMFISDSANHPAYDGMPQSERPGALACLPLIIGEHILGTLNLGFWEPHDFDRETRRFLHLMASHAALAIDNARLYTDARSRARWLDALREVSLDITAQLSLKDVVQNVVRHVAELVGAGGGHVFLFDKERQILELYAEYGEVPGLVGRELKLGEGISGRVAATRQPLTVQDYATWDGHAAGFQDAPIMAVAVVPLLWRDQVLGTLGVHTQSGNPRTFSHDDLQLMEQLAAQAAIAIQNAQLYESASRAAKELRRLYDTSLDLTSELETPNLLDLIIQRAAELLRADSGNFYFYDATTNELIPRAPFGEHRVRPVARLKPGEGATGLVFLSGEPLLVQDYDTWEGRVPWIPPGRYARILHVPVKRGDRVLGVMSVNRSKEAPPFTQEEMRLLMLFANQAAIALENARLYQVGVEKARMEREFELARVLQASLIPAERPRIPGWEFAAMWLPAHETSGDFFDFVELPGDAQSRSQKSLCLMLGDVSDKGMAAALLMAMTRSTVRASMSPASSPAECITHANRLISADTENGNFVTLCFARLDPATGEMVYVNAGHNPPWLYRQKEDRFEKLERTGIAIGVDGARPYNQRTVTLEPGDAVLLYTDGVTDAANADEERFGDERLERLVFDLRHSTADEIVAAVGEAVDEFVGATPRFDDLTVLAIRRSNGSG